MKNRLDLIETSLQNFIEASSMIFPWGSRRSLFSTRLVEALRSSLYEDENGQLTAPSLYTIFMCRENHAFWEKHQDLFISLAQTLQEASRENGITFEFPPVIRLAVNEKLMPDELTITVEESSLKTGSTAALVVNPTPSEVANGAKPANAFIIYNDQTIPLSQAVINIGRKLDNHIIVDDPRVSRSHAQLRAVGNRYLIFDLNSTGGTYVNGNRITRQFLYAGDVISLAGVALVYGEENELTNSNTTSMTLEKDPPSE